MFNFEIDGVRYRIWHDTDTKTLEFGVIDPDLNAFRLIKGIMSSDIGGIYESVKECIQALLAWVNRYLFEKHGNDDKSDFVDQYEELTYRITNNLSVENKQVVIKDF